MLIKAGADVNAQNPLYQTVLQKVFDDYDTWRRQPPEREGRQQWLSTLSAMVDFLVGEGAICRSLPRHARCPN